MRLMLLGLLISFSVLGSTNVCVEFMPETSNCSERFKFCADVEELNSSTYNVTYPSESNNCLEYEVSEAKFKKEDLCNKFINSYGDQRFFSIDSNLTVHGDSGSTRDGRRVKALKEATCRTSSTTGQSHSYLEIGRLIKKAKLPKLSNVSGKAWSGKCFNLKDASTPYVLGINASSDSRYTWNLADTKNSEPGYNDNLQFNDYLKLWPLPTWTKGQIDRDHMNLMTGEERFYVTYLKDDDKENLFLERYRNEYYLPPIRCKFVNVQRPVVVQEPTPIPAPIPAPQTPTNTETTSNLCPGEEGYYFTNFRSSNPKKGGFVSNTAFVDESLEGLFIAPTSAVCGNANVAGIVRLIGNVIIRGFAELAGTVTVNGNIVVEGNAKITGISSITGSGSINSGTLNNETLTLNQPTPHAPAPSTPGTTTTPGTNTAPTPTPAPSTSENSYTCGMEGSIEARIADCKQKFPGEIEGIEEVTRVSYDFSLWRDKKSGLIWSTRLEKEMNFANAVKECPITLKKLTNLSSDWRLPSKKEFETAIANDNFIVKYLKGSFWTQTAEHKESKQVWIYTPDTKSASLMRPETNWIGLACVTGKPVDGTTPNDPNPGITYLAESWIGNVVSCEDGQKRARQDATNPYRCSQLSGRSRKAEVIKIDFTKCSNINGMYTVYMTYTCREI